MLKVYTESNLLTEAHRRNVFPLLFDLCYLKDHPVKEWYVINDKLQEADIAIWPLEYGFTMKLFKNKYQQFLNEAKNHNKKIWVYSGGDNGYTINDADILNFRLGGFKSKLNERQIIIPSFINDPYIENLKKDFAVLKKQELPKIGFVGHASGGFIKYIREVFHYFRINVMRLFKRVYADYQAFYPSSIKRKKYLNKFKIDNRIISNFIFREKYRAGAKTEEERIKSTTEFYQNIYESPYTFCLRGNGNFSVRFYETLAVGRIPVLLDTDCLLPLNSKIDWNNHCLRIQEQDDHIIAEKLVEFHSKISEKEFESMQSKNRELWENYLTRHIFFKHIHDMFSTNELNYEA